MPYERIVVNALHFVSNDTPFQTDSAAFASEIDRTGVACMSVEYGQYGMVSITWVIKADFSSIRASCSEMPR